MKVGTKVQQVLTAPINGTVVDVRWNVSADCKEILVSYDTEDGTPATRWFFDAELAQV